MVDWESVGVGSVANEGMEVVEEDLVAREAVLGCEVAELSSGVAPSRGLVEILTAAHATPARMSKRNCTVNAIYHSQ